jgi:hypothetical protein
MGVINQLLIVAAPTTLLKFAEMNEFAGSELAEKGIFTGSPWTQFGFEPMGVLRFC